MHTYNARIVWDGNLGGFRNDPETARAEDEVTR
jgi:hypothetical protein